MAPSVIGAGARPPAHLIILVDRRMAVDEPAGFSPGLDAGTGWIVSVEVAEATDALVRGLGEAVGTAAATCPVSGCTALAVLDLRSSGSSPEASPAATAPQDAVGIGGRGHSKPLAAGTPSGE